MPTAYYRTIPKWIKMAPTTLPVHRLVSVERRLLTSYIADQAERLQAEDVEITEGIVPATYFWNPIHFYKGA